MMSTRDRRSNSASSGGATGIGANQLSPLLTGGRRASRSGSNAGTYGLVTLAVSDHLPVLITSKAGTKILSWNMLADVHLYNLFLNVTGSHVLISELITQRIDKENPYLNRKLHHFFSELAQYLYTYCLDTETMTITVTPDALKGFTTDLKKQDSLLLRAGIEKEKILKARQQMIDILLSNSKHKLEYDNVFGRCVELIYHIQNKSGALKWSNRFEKLKNNKKLLAQLREIDIHSFQECTDPAQVKTLLYPKKSDNDRMKMITYKVNSQTNDHCVLMYNSEKFSLLEKRTYALNGNKPCIFAKLQNNNGEKFIVGSIHYPGGDHHLLHEIMTQVNILRKTEGDIPFYIVGDFNHDANFFAEDLSTFSDETTLLFPEAATMAGKDFGNAEKPIDAVLTKKKYLPNVDNIQILKDIEQANPVPSLITVKIERSEEVTETPAPPFTI